MPTYLAIYFALVGRKIITELSLFRPEKIPDKTKNKYLFDLLYLTENSFNMNFFADSFSSISLALHN